MSSIPPDELLMRAVALYVPLILVMGLGLLVPPRVRVAMLLAGWWNLWSIHLLNELAVREGFWTFMTQQAVLGSIPVDLWFGWTLLWAGATAALPFSLPAKLIFLLVMDTALMPQLGRLVVLHEGWWIGDILMIGLCYLPGELLYRWTLTRRSRKGQNWLLAACFVATLIYLLPFTIMELANRSWQPLLSLPYPALSIYCQLAFLSLLPLAAAIQCFTRFGRGTPVPLDPSTRLIRRGVFSYVANPMQISMCLALIVVAAVLQEPLLLLGSLLLGVFSEGFARWSEHEYARITFAARWDEYVKNVPRWLPRYRPWVPEVSAPAVAYFSEACGVCSNLRKWIETLQPRDLIFIDAEDHPRGRPRRLRYVDAESGVVLEGVRAFAAVLNHTSLPCAVFGWLIDLPLVSSLCQLVVDCLVERESKGARACPTPRRIIQR